MRGLTANIVATGQQILNGVDLTIREGEVHTIMGKNGSGKSTLSKVLVGHPDYEVTGGSASFRGKDLFGWEPEERSHHGLFLSFQSPVEIPGVSNIDFLRMAANANRKAAGQPELDPLEFYAHVMPKVEGGRAHAWRVHGRTQQQAWRTRAGRWPCARAVAHACGRTHARACGRTHADAHTHTAALLLLLPQLEMLKMDPTFLNRNVNEGFSGGEKKRNEILQLAVLEVGAGHVHPAQRCCGGCGGRGGSPWAWCATHPMSATACSSPRKPPRMRGCTQEEARLPSSHTAHPRILLHRPRAACSWARARTCACTPSPPHPLRAPRPRLPQAKMAGA